MTDEELVQAFESVTLAPAAFSHAAHVRVAWWYLQQASLPDALGRFSAGLRRFAAAHGVPGKYHETMTVAWVLLIAERLGPARALPWDAFAERHPELFETPSLLTRYYTADILASDRARSGFVMPDRGGCASRP